MDIDEYNSHMNSPRVQKILQWEEEFDGDWLSVDAGPGHIVFSDYNTGNGSIDYCIERVYNILYSSIEHLDNYPCFKDICFEELYKHVHWTLDRLLELKTLPEDWYGL